MVQPKPKVPSPAIHRCPVCDHPQTKLQRRLGAATQGSLIYVCARAGECSVGIDVTKIETWVAV